MLGSNSISVVLWRKWLSSILLLFVPFLERRLKVTTLPLHYPSILLSLQPFLLCSHLTYEVTSAPECAPILVKHKGYRSGNDEKEAAQRRGPVRSKSTIHGGTCERKRCAQNASEETVSRTGAGTVYAVTCDQV